MTTVSVSLGATINTGNFSSIRLDYSLTDDVRSGETVNDAYARVEAKVDEQIQRRMKIERED